MQIPFFPSLYLFTNTCYQQNNTLLNFFFLHFLFLSPSLYALSLSNSVTVYKATWVKRAIKSRNHAWIIHARVEVNALKRMVNGNVDAMHGGKVHDVNDV